MALLLNRQPIINKDTYIKIDNIVRYVDKDNIPKVIAGLEKREALAASRISMLSTTLKDRFVSMMKETYKVTLSEKDADSLYQDFRVLSWYNIMTLDCCRDLEFDKNMEESMNGRTA